MNAGQLQSLKDLIEFLKQQDVGEFELEQDDLKVRLTFAGHGVSTGNVDFGHMTHLIQAAKSMPQTIAASPTPVPHLVDPDTATASSATAASDDAGLHIVKSPIVGTFYEASAPGAEPFIKVGDTVESGQVICIVEAMKLMNEIECDAAGEVVKRLVTNGQPVEYGQALFAIRPR